MVFSTIIELFICTLIYTFILTKRMYGSTVIKTELLYISVTYFIIYTLLICCINIQYACITDNIIKSTNVQPHIGEKSTSLVYKSIFTAFKHLF